MLKFDDKFIIMNKGKYVFTQLTEFLPQRVFDSLVAKYSGNKYVRHFTCWNQLLCIIFGQLTNRDSLRNLIVTIDAHSQKTYHLGFGKSVTRSNLAKANENRNSKIFEAFAYHLIDIARKKQANDNFEIKGKIYAFDSSTIDLCLSVGIATFYRTASKAIKALLYKHEAKPKKVRQGIQAKSSRTFLCKGQC